MGDNRKPENKRQLHGSQTTHIHYNTFLSYFLVFDMLVILHVADTHIDSAIIVYFM